MISESEAQAPRQKPVQKNFPIKQIELDTHEKISYLELGDLEDGKPVVLLHGLLGSGAMFVGSDDVFERNGIHALAPNLFGPHTDWDEMNSVGEVGQCVSDLADHVFKGKEKPDVLGVSAGGGPAAAMVAAHNRKYGPGAVKNLILVSAQPPLYVGGESFQLLENDPEKQRNLKAILGVRRQTRLRILQPIPNGIARLKGRVADKRIEATAGTDALFDQNLFGDMSWSDKAVFDAHPELKETLRRAAIEYTKEEIYESIYRLCGSWNVDFRWIQGTKVTMYQGNADKVVPLGNAEIWERMFREAEVQKLQVIKKDGDGHLQLIVRQEEIAGRLGKKEASAGLQEKGQ